MCFLHTAGKLGTALAKHHEDMFENKPLGYKWVSANQESKIKFLDCQTHADIV